MIDKVKRICDVVRGISDGAHIALGGFAIARNVISFAHELIRQEKRNLTLSQCVMGLDTDLLVGAGLVERLIVGGGSLDRFGQLHCVNRARETGQVMSMDYSSLAVCFGYLAAALGVSFIPIKSLLGSEVLDRLEAGPGAGHVRHMNCPFTGEEYVLIKAVVPDISVVHVQEADREGNCRINGPRWENEEQAKAARRVIVVTEKLVSTEYFRRFPERTVLPGHRVEAVIHQPFGAHPTAVFGCYDYDSDHLRFYEGCARTPERVSEYIEEYVIGTKDHWDYLEKVGGLKSVSRLTADPILGY